MKVAGQELSVVAVGRVLEQHRADALGHAAAHLALDDRGVDEHAAVLDHHVAVDLRPGRSPGRPPLRRSASHPTTRPRRRRRRRSRRGWRRRRRGCVPARRLRRRPLEAARALVGTPRTATGRSMISRSSTLASSRWPARSRTLARRARATCERGAAGQGRRPAAAGEAGRHDIGVAHHDPHVLERHAELVGRDLRQRRLVALPVGHLPREHAHRAVAVQPGADVLGAERAVAAEAPARPRCRSPSPTRGSGPRRGLRPGAGGTRACRRARRRAPATGGR